MSFPILVVIPFPGEDNFLSRHEFAVFAATSHFLTFRIGQVPTKFAADPHIGDEIVSLNKFRAEPLSSLRRAGSGRRICPCSECVCWASIQDTFRQKSGSCRY